MKWSSTHSVGQASRSSKGGASSGHFHIQNHCKSRMNSLTSLERVSQSLTTENLQDQVVREMGRSSPSCIQTPRCFLTLPSLFNRHVQVFSQMAPGGVNLMLCVFACGKGYTHVNRLFLSGGGRERSAPIRRKVGAKGPFPPPPPRAFTLSVPHFPRAPTPSNTVISKAAPSLPSLQRSISLRAPDRIHHRVSVARWGSGRCC